MSNPIASETAHGAVLHDGHYGPVHCYCSECDCLVDSAEAQLQSDPSGKGAQGRVGRFREYVATLEGKVSQLEAERKYFHDAYARKLDETIDALGKLLSVTDERDFLERELNNFRRNAAHRAEQIAEEKLAPLTSQVSVLTKERDELKKERQ